ncbi:MAG: cytochrome c biogenesis protein CcsA [Gemmataceae bacterium]|nr:cytochrome c biogenesis protein CcsA [Gemmataceae bacterium]MBJ7345759.1 cytochrome c biogenesis protein CcsA [Gemmataceae bacterium]
MHKSNPIIPIIAVVLGFTYFCFQAYQPPDPVEGFHLEEFARLPIVDRGRVKPMDTFARVSLMVMNDGFQTFKPDISEKEKAELTTLKNKSARTAEENKAYLSLSEKDKRQPAVRWLLDVMTSRFSDNHIAEKHKVFRIENDQLLGLLALQPRPGLRYSIEEFAPQIGELEKAGKAADQKENAKKDAFDKSVLQLAHHLQSYMEIASLQTPLVIPAGKGEDWKPFMQAALESRNANQADPNAGMNPTVSVFGQMLLSYLKNEPLNFNKALIEYRELITKELPVQSEISGFEVFFNHFAPFYHCIVVYLFVFLISCFAWVTAPATLNKTAFWLCILTLLVHTWALGSRMYIQGRPPVTNLYSSAIFIGWGCVLGCLMLEAVYKNGIGNIVGSITGSLTLLIAQHLSSEGDTLEMMQAVLDTNFWLATHVTCVTLGYTATFVAGFLGIVYVIMGLVTTTLTPDRDKSLTQMIYGVVCFAMLFSFVGTVLGGIWADQSWGRFWGWDPKENGALLIVIWNAIILHARWGGMAKNRGVALLSIAGNMVTGWSWFGTNQLGVGLHAYGFNDQLAWGLTAFWLSQLGLIGVGLIPRQYWLSSRIASKTSSIPVKLQPKQA